MAFKFKDLMVNVTGGGGGVDTPVCTVATMDPDPAPAGQARQITCTMDTMVPAGQAATCTVDTMDPARQAATCTVDTMGLLPCTIATMYGTTYGFRPATGRDTGVCTIATMFGTVAALTTVTTVTTIVAAGAGPSSLAQLKAQLQQSLADVERQEREQADAQALPKSVEEVDDLERRLEGALEELREHRKTLTKGAKKEPAKPRKGKK